MMTRPRKAILAELARVGREHSDATVLFHASIADKLSLHATDYKVLGILLQKGALSAGDIAQRTGLAAASVTNLIERLVKKKFARRVQDTTDRRRVLVEANVEKVSDNAKIFASTIRSLAELFERYNAEELEVIASFLAANAKRLREETVKLSAVPRTQNRRKPESS